jgi:hypothetical protein
MPAHEKHAIEEIQYPEGRQANLVNQYVLFRNNFLAMEVGNDALRGVSFIALRATLLDIVKNDWVRANLPNAMQELRFVIEIGEGLPHLPNLPNPDEQVRGLRDAYTDLLAYSKQGIWNYFQTNVAALGKTVTEGAAGILTWVQNWWRGGEVAPAERPRQ